MTESSIKNPPGLDGLLFRRQFVLTSDPALLLGDCPQLRIGPGCHLSAHPDLELTHVGDEAASLTLLGFALDPEHPEDGNAEILHRLAASADLHAAAIRAAGKLGGRWVLIVHHSGQTVVLHDACAQRQVFFTAGDYDGPFMCASEPAVMAEKLGLDMNPEAVDFIRSRKVDDFEIYWMPGDTTLYAEITALLPNHLLSLHDRKPTRYWPQARPPELDQESALRESIGMLSGIMESAANRFPLSIPMTAGWDSRLVLALNRSRASTLHTFTIAYPGDSAKSRDIAVPQRLLDKLGMSHYLVPYPESVDAAFKGLVRRNNASCNAAYSADIQALHECHPQDRVCVTGDVAEIVKRYFHGASNHPGNVTAEKLAQLSRFGPHPFARKALSRWLEDAARQPLDVLDLFCWEQMAGRWQGKVRSEFDIVQESFAPLNCRALLELMLGVDHRLRRAPSFEFFRLIIQRLWPETLLEPINPPEGSLPRRILSRLKRCVLSSMAHCKRGVTQGLRYNEY
jgi:hypothetical protein